SMVRSSESLLANLPVMLSGSGGARSGGATASPLPAGALHPAMIAIHTRMIRRIRRRYHAPNGSSVGGTVRAMGAKIVVLGGGACGMTAALALAREGAEVTVLEREPRAGGLCGTVERDGF